MSKLLIALSLTLSIGLLSGCGGGGSEVTNVSTTTTMGKELQDLDESHKQGIINDDQYKEAKEKILDRYNK